MSFTMTYIYDADPDATESDDAIDTVEITEAVADYKSILFEDDEDVHDCGIRDMLLLDITTEAW